MCWRDVGKSGAIVSFGSGTKKGPASGVKPGCVSQLPDLQC